MTPSIQLKPLEQQQWDNILRKRIPEYAKEQVRAGRWSESEALAEASAEFEKLLPEGVETPRNHVHGIIDQANQAMVGYLWYAEREKAGKPSVFICDLRVFENYRRQGFASAALLAVEKVVLREHGATRIELHVFGSNLPARSLYASTDYVETNVLMAKNLG